MTKDLSDFVANMMKAGQGEMLFQDFVSALETDAFDAQSWQDAVKEIPQLRQMDIETSMGISGLGDGCNPIQDLFLSLYQNNPVIDPAPGHEAMASILGKVMEAPGYTELHPHTKNELYASAFGTKALKRIVHGLPQEVKDAARNYSNASQQAESMRQALKTLEEIAPGVEGGQEKVERLEAEILEAEGNAKSAENKFNETLEANQNGIKAMASGEMSQQAESAQAMEAITRGLSQNCLSKGQRFDASEMAQIAKFLGDNKNIQALVDMLGWAMRTVDGAYRDANKGGMEVVDITTGKLDAKRMVPQDRLSMIGALGDAMQDDFMRRLGENKVNLYETTGDEDKQGKGSLVIVTDQSGSMAGSPRKAAVALEWALWQACQEPGDTRDFYSIPFAGRGQYHIWKAPEKGSKGLLGEVIQHLSEFMSGSTEIFKPIKEAMLLADSEGLKSDCLILTDARIGTPDSHWLDDIQYAKSKGMRFYVVLIGGAGQADKLDWADTVLSMSDLMEDRDKLKPILKSMMQS